MKTLYITDLDGTLLRSDETLSEYSKQNINNLVNEGMLFGYATARSLSTSKKVTKGIDVHIPIIVQNGIMIRDYISGEVIVGHYFSHEIHNVIDDMIHQGVYPIVYHMLNGKELFSYYKEGCSDACLDFIKTRYDDYRRREVSDITSLYEGEIFYLTCIDDSKKLDLLYKKYSDDYHCIYDIDYYKKENRWLELLPKNISKASAVKVLKQLLDCDRIVVFGDGLNDIEMFEIADESYAMENACDKLKSIASGVIGSNDDDSVMKFILDDYSK